jgi:hypothetical protein
VLLPLWFTPIFFIIAGIAGFLCRKISDILFSCGVVFTLVFAFYCIYFFSKDGFQVSYFGSEIDLSYSLFGLPFLLNEIRN